MSKFTPGPWVIDWNVARLDIFSSDAKVLVASLRRSAMSPAIDEAARANARLIAAAPNLYAALVKTMKKCRCRGTGVWTRSCTLCGDSTFDHECNDKCLPCDDADCVAARAVIAEVGGVA